MTREGAVVRVRLLRPGARLPRRATEQATGFDVYASIESGSIAVGHRPVPIGTGLALEVPPGYDAQVRPRSGLARQGVLSTFGTIDADYRGEVMVTMYTLGPDIRHVVHDGDRIAQIVITQLAPVTFEAADVLSETARGEGGHGSTGR
jgi:dUTP pyrophosphatase